MVTEKEKILKFLNNNKLKLSQDFGVDKIGLFGSYLNNSQNENSDVDILIEVRKEFKKYNYYYELKKFLETNIDKEVDIVYKDAINPLINMEIQKDIVYV
ncbi:MAG: nucleotidyltransferase domain-containing protein [Ignavibacteriae bacterium]|nr:nucleotidyltransferase domain-containing protein [Ignavibacteriota bacterium]